MAECTSALYSTIVMHSLPAFTVFDVETTGLDPRRGDKIIEIAGIRIENGVIQESKTYTQFVNPERTIPWEAKRVNNIEDEDVANAPTIEQVLPEFLAFANDSILVAQNASFDMKFLEVEKELCWGYIELPECFCTMKLSQNLYPQEFRHNLDVIAQRFGLQMPESRHRALPDVLLTAQALLHMIQEHKLESIDNIRQRACLQKLAEAK